MDGKSQLLPASLDITDHMVSGDGIAGYRWPLDIRKQADACKHFVAAVNEFYREEKSEDLFLIKIIINRLMPDFTSIMFAQLLRQYSGDDAPVLPGHATYWDLVFRRKDMIYERRHKIESGLPRPGFWIRLLRSLKPAFMSNGLTPRALPLTPFKTGIVTTGGGELVFEHARQVPEKVYSCKLYDWFYPPERDEIEKRADLRVDPAMIERFADKIEGVFDTAGCGLAPHLRQHFINQISSLTYWARFYTDRLLERPERIPKRLWMGTQGIIWNKILAYAVQALGGEVSVHAHGEGGTMFGTAFAEFQFCDEFICYSDAQADSLRAASHWMLGDRLPRLKPVRRPLRGASPQSRQANRPPSGTEIKRVMFVLPIYRTDYIDLFPVMPDIVALDWQARLIGWLQEKGYEVLVKPHPEGRIKPDRILSEALGCEVLHGRFEHVYEDADLILYDYSYSTTFGTGLKSDKPVVLIDFEEESLPAHVMEMLQKRVNIVPGRFDGENRAQTDWAMLESALQSAVHRKDDSYVREYLGSEANPV